MPEQCEMKPRNRGVDALRILATLMVLILHVLNIGQILSQMSAEQPAYWMCMVLFVAAFGAVNCYGLISGYVGLFSRYRYSKLILLWLQVVFYNLLALLVVTIAGRRLPQVAELLRAITPLLHLSFWYFTAYFGMFFLVPVMNRGLRALTRQQARAVFWSIFVLFSVLPTLTGADQFVTQVGYSVIWLVLLYILGGCIRKGELFSRAPTWVLLLLFWICVALSLLVRWLLPEPILLFGAIYQGYTLISYTAPTVLFCAVILLVIFSRMKCTGPAGKLVAILAPASFGIYIMHMQQDLRPLIFETPLFAWISQQNAAVAPLTVLLTALVLFVICAAIEMVRQRLFRVLNVQTALEKLENKLLGKLWDDK